MRGQVSPIITVKQREVPPSNKLETLRAFFVVAKPIPLLQRFPEGNPKASASGTVRVVWSGASIQILAELDDKNIFTRATQFNEPLYLLGDCFEIFLQRTGELPYLEFHVAPNNITLQLLYPSHADFVKYRPLSEEEFAARFTVKKRVFASQVWLAPDEERWTVFASIDLRLLAPTIITLAEEHWKFQFSRYDYPIEGGSPVLSCTSVLQHLDFHALQDWGTLDFKP